MKDPLKQILILIAVCLIGANSCTKDNNQLYYDTDALKKAFDQIGDIYEISLTKELRSNTKTLSQIKKEIGIPIEEYVDTFEYGSYVYSNNPDKHIDPYYDIFPDTLWTIQTLIIHKCVWAYGDKDITVFFLNDRKKREQPIWGYISEYTDWYRPLRLLPEKDFTINEVIKMRGKPINVCSYKVSYGVDYAPLADIYRLRDVPEAIIQSYTWKVDSARTLILSYMEDEDKSTAKPIRGILCNDEYLMYE